MALGGPEAPKTLHVDRLQWQLGNCGESHRNLRGSGVAAGLYATTVWSMYFVILRIVQAIIGNSTKRILLDHSLP